MSRPDFTISRHPVSFVARTVSPVRRLSLRAGVRIDYNDLPQNSTASIGVAAESTLSPSSYHSTLFQWALGVSFALF